MTLSIIGVNFTYGITEALFESKSLDTVIEERNSYHYASSPMLQKINWVASNPGSVNYM